MRGSNPLQQRLHAEAVKNVARNVLGMEHFSIIALISVALFFLGAGWLPDAATNVLLPGGNRIVGVCQGVGSAIIFIIFGFLLNRQIRELQTVRVASSIPEPARVLVVFLSFIGGRDKEKQLLRLKANEQIDAEMLLDTAWEMPWLAVNHHVKRLETLYVITSPGERGSHIQFPVFRSVMQGLHPHIEVKPLTDGGVDFEDIAAVHRCLDQLYDDLDALKTYGSHDVMVDITGGQKPNSIAAAMATLAEGRRFQYISTNKKNVLCYDLVVERT